MPISQLKAFVLHLVVGGGNGFKDHSEDCGAFQQSNYRGLHPCQQQGAGEGAVADVTDITRNKHFALHTQRKILHQQGVLIHSELLHCGGVFFSKGISKSYHADTQHVGRL